MVMLLQCSICIWIFLWPSAVCLSPPQNVSVEFLDFQGRVHWLAGAGNSNHTHYSVEIRALSESWWQPCNCSDPVAMVCPLENPLDDLFKNYNVRVRAELEEQKSDWKYLENTVQPYSDTVLSAPGLSLWVEENQTLCVLLHHPAQNIFKLYNITLLKNVQEHNATIMTDIVSASKRVFHNLSPDHTYCLLASANHYSLRRHMTAQGCVNLTRHRPDQQKLVGMAVGVFLLMAVLIGLIAVTRYVLKSTDHTPKALSVRSAGCLVTPENVVCHPVTCGTAPSGYLDYELGAVMTFHLNNRLETETPLPCSLDNRLETETPLPCSLDNRLETETPLPCSLDNRLETETPLPCSLDNRLETETPLPCSLDNRLETETLLPCSLDDHLETETFLPCSLDDHLETETILPYSLDDHLETEASLPCSLHTDIGSASPLPVFTLTISGGNTKWTQDQRLGATSPHTLLTLPTSPSPLSSSSLSPSPSSFLPFGYSLACDSVSNQRDTETHTDRTTDRMTDRWDSRSQQSQDRLSDCELYSPGASLCSFSRYEPRPDPTLNLT